MIAAMIIGFIGILSMVLTSWLARPDAPIRIVDQPNERSLHEMPTPRTGGIAICLALSVAWIAFLLMTSPVSMPPAQILVGAAIAAIVSILDDRFGLSRVLRFSVQVGAALVLIYDGFVIRGDLLPGLNLEAGWIAIATTLVTTVWLTNLYNFMDGMDGFAGGMAVIGFGALAALGWGQGDTLFAGASLTVAAAAAGFLWFNFPPARIFMGDSGSTTLGFLVAAFAIWASRRDIAPVWLTLVIFSPFVVDATVTLLKRAVRREPVWRAHRSHYYQRLVQAGWGHRRTVLAEYVAMLACAAAALAAVGADWRAQWAMLCLLAIAYTGAALAILKIEKKHDANIHS